MPRPQKLPKTRGWLFPQRPLRMHVGPSPQGHRRCTQGAIAKAAEDPRLAAAAKATEDARNAATATAAEDARKVATAKATEKRGWLLRQKPLKKHARPLPRR